MSQHGDNASQGDSGNPTSPDSNVDDNDNIGNAAPLAPAASAPAEAQAQAQAAEDDDAPAPGNERAPAAAAPSDDEDLSAGPGNAIESSDDDEDDNIGNRIDGPDGNAASVAAATSGPTAGAGKKRNRKKKKPAGQAQAQGEGGNANAGGGHRPEVQHRAFKAGDKVRARVIEIGQGAALCDLWGKEVGVLDLRELAIDNPEPKVGDSVDVVVLQDGARGGNLVVTRDPSRADAAREFIAQARTSGEPVEGVVTGVNKGGIEVDVGGVRGFCPASQVDVRLPSQPELQALVLRRELFKVVDITDHGREVVLSRRALREGEVRARALEAVQAIKVGDKVTGRVVAVKDHGIFVDLGGVEGRIQLSEISHDRGARPQDIAKVGDEIEALVLRVDIPQPTAPAEAKAPETPTAEFPAADEGAAEEHATGEHPEGEAAATAEGEATAAEGEGEAAATAAEGEAARPRKGPREKRKPQRFSRLPEGTPRVELSRRAVEPDPWAEVPKKYPVNSVHKGKVARMQPFGAFIELERGVDGLLHVSEIGERRIQHPNEVLQDGQEVTVRVTRIDRGQRRIGLAMLPEGVTEEQLKNSITPKPGMVTTAKVTEHESYGIWAQLDGTVGKVGRG
ncbi:MAG: S1 RNA-binding domain-containing protein [Polyangiales bacterium]